jgi:hypothetical protein
MSRITIIFGVVILAVTLLNVFTAADRQQPLDACNVFNTCASCVQGIANSSIQCGWCAATQMCVTGSPLGPSAGKCLGAWEFGVCRHCDQLLTCRECTKYPADCVWCSFTKTCHHVDNPLPINCVPTELCGCDDYRHCSDCVMSSICAWCPDLNACVPKGVLNASCHETRCPCSLHKSCDLCTDDDMCDWCTDNFIGRCVDSDNTTCVSRAHTCELFCERATDCISCQLLNNACGWCPTTGMCIDTNVNTACQIERFCSNDPKRCSARSNCEACLGIPGDPCVWCNGKCVASLKECPTGAQTTCPAPSNFSAGSFFGGMFLMIGLIGLAIVGYVVYMRIRGKRLNYSVVS